MFTDYISSNHNFLPNIHFQKEKISFKRNGNIQETPFFQYARSVLMKNQYTKPKPSKLSNNICTIDFKKTIKTDRSNKPSEEPHPKNMNINISQETKKKDKISPHKQQIRSFGMIIKPDNTSRRSSNGRNRINSCKVVLNKVFPSNKKHFESINLMNNIQDDALSSIPKLDWDADKFMTLESFNHLAF